MKNLKLLLTACLFSLMANLASSQPLYVAPKSVQAKNHYRTKVFLTDGTRYKGKLIGCSDSTITLYLEIYTNQNSYFTDQQFVYRNINEIKLVERMKGTGALIGGLAGLTTGIIYGLGVSSYNEINTWFGEGEDVTGYVVGGLLIGTAVGALIGTGIESATRKRYSFVISGNYDTFASYRNDLKLMVIRP